MNDTTASTPPLATPVSVRGPFALAWYSDLAYSFRHSPVAIIMRIADVQLSFPAILIALLIDGVARVMLPRGAHDNVAIAVLIFAIGASNWVQYARTVRGSTMVEKNKEYVQAARVIGISPL